MLRKFRDFLMGRALTSRASLWAYICLQTFYFHPVIAVVKLPINFLYSLYLTNRLCGFSLLPRLYFSAEIFKVKITKARTAKVRSEVKNIFVFENWLGGNEPLCINLEASASLNVNNEFYLGDGCKVNLLKGATLTLGGRSPSQISGLTCKSIILCSSDISIGMGTIVSWGCYITDSTQHSINGGVKIAPVRIGNHVWISEGVTCTPGGVVGDGCVIGSKSYVNKVYAPRSFIAGAPAVVLKNNVTWHR